MSKEQTKNLPAKPRNASPRRTYIAGYEETKKAELVSLGNGPKSWNEILKYLKVEIKKSTEIVNFNYRISCFKEDGAYQLHKAVGELTGAAESVGDEKPSGGKDNVELIDVQLSDGSRVKVPFGTIALSDMGEGAQINIAYDNARNELVVTGSCEFRFQTLMDHIIDRTKHLLNTNSIYRNQAFQLEGNFKPKYLNLDNIDKEFMILSEKTERELKPLMARIEHPEVCEAKGIPLKYGCLLEGPYGTGKTLLAFKIARKAIQKDWTFIYLKSPELLAGTLKLSKTLDKNGNGVIVFVEDIDQVTKGNRNAAMQDILNTLDGGDTKQMNVIALFTTNHIDQIEPTFLRGKRIGSIVSMGYLDAPTAQAFLEQTFADDYVLDRKGLKPLCEYIELNNIAPAFMAEIVESVKTNMIFEESNEVKTQYIKDSVDNYLRQVELSKTKDLTETPQVKLANSLVDVLFNSTVGTKYKEDIITRIQDSL